MGLYEFEGKRPSVHPSAFVHPEATLIGDVRVGPNCYIGAGARLRADWGSIVAESDVNIQENCVLHVQPGDSVVLGPRCHIGHGAILHGPKLGTHVVVGMGAILMDGVTIGDGSCVAAGALVTSGTKVGENRLLVGVPARDAGEVGEKLRESLDWGTRMYMALPQRCFKGLTPHGDGTR